MKTTSFLPYVFTACAALGAFGVGTLAARPQGGELPKWLSYQGRLTTPDGAAVEDGQYSAEFKIYDAPTSGALLWSESAQVAAFDGVFSTTLGQSTAFPADLFTRRLWLETTIEGRTLVPRQELGAVAFAMTAQTAMSLPPDTVDSSMIQDGQVMSGDIADGSVFGSKIPGGAIGNSHIADGAVGSSKISDDAVGTAKVQNGAIVSGKLANGAVGSPQLASDPASLFKVSNGSLAALSNGGVQVFGNTNIPGDRLLGYSTSDAFSYDGKTMGHYAQGWFGDSWSSQGATYWVSGYAGIKFFVGGQVRMHISPSGNVRVYGNLQVDGDLTDGSEYRDLYASQSPIPVYEDRISGVAQTRDGSATVKLDSETRKRLHGDYLVHITPYGDSFLYVAEIGEDRFVVRCRSGNPDVRFSWRLSAFRKGSEWSGERRSQ